MTITFTLNQVPVNGEALDATGLPWGAILQPLDPPPAPTTSVTGPLPSSDEVARCKKCFAYVNRFAVFERRKWVCSLCGQRNHLTDRYSSPASRTRLPELNDPIYEAELPLEGADHRPVQTANQGPIYVAVIDLAGNDEFLELVKSGLLAALEGLPPYARLCLVTVSDRLGVYDLHSATPHVRYSTIGADEAAPLPIAEMMPLKRMLAQLKEHKDNIVFALDTLKSSPSMSSYGASGFGTEVGPRRGFGPAVLALVDLLAALDFLVPVRVTMFLSGIPNFGVGALDPKRAEESDGHSQSRDKLLLEATPFYRVQGERLAVLGASVDVYVVTREFVDLASIQPLVTLTGGVLRLYDPDHTTLPQDLYRSVSTGCGFDGELRLRTSPEIRVGRAYGPITPHRKFDNVYHLPLCQPHTALAIDLELANPSGFSSVQSRDPCFQMAYAYTYVESRGEGGRPGTEAPQEGPSGAANGAAKSAQCTLRRRLRIHTVVCTVASSAADLYNSADAAASLTILTHKVVVAGMEAGIREARLLLEDWLVLLVTRYNALINPQIYSTPNLHSTSIDVTLTAYQALSALPRLVYLLLCSRLLRVATLAPDELVHLQHLYRTVEAGVLLQLISPLVYGYATPDHPTVTSLPLSREAFTASGASLFLIDAWADLIVYYSAAAGDIPFPPPLNSALRQQLNECRQGRHVTPRMTMIRAGTTEAQHFDLEWLVEDRSNIRMGLSGFLNYIAGQVCKYLAS